MAATNPRETHAQRAISLLLDVRENVGEPPHDAELTVAAAQAHATLAVADELSKIRIYLESGISRTSAESYRP
jgi:hypothetical protein